MAVALQASEHKAVNPKDNQHWVWTFLNLPISENLSQSTDIFKKFHICWRIYTPAFASRDGRA